MPMRLGRSVLAVALAVAGAAVTPAAAGPGAGTGATCDPADPPSCTLAEVAARHGIRFGATAEPAEVAPGPYADVLTGQFSSVTPENALKWYATQATRGTFTFEGGDAVVDFAVAQGLEVRGHTLVWSQDAYTPAWVRAISDEAVLRAELTTHITTVVDHFEDRVRRWDVVNEPLETLGTGPSDNVYRRVLGPDWIAEAFAIAAAADPTAELWLNEYGSDWVAGKHDALLALVTGLLDDGVPIDGIGLQLHRVSVDGPDVEVLAAQMRDFTALGLEVAITELDVRTDPADPDALTRQADAYRRVVEACLRVERCVEITTWGVTDASTWLDTLGLWPTPTRPLLFDEAFRPKPAYYAVLEALAAELVPLAPPAPRAPVAPPALPVAQTPRFIG